MVSVMGIRTIVVTLVKADMEIRIGTGMGMGMELE